MARRVRDRGGKAKATKVRVKSFSERAAGGTIRKLTERELPTGCSVMTNQVPCTFAMTHIALRIHHAIWDAQNEPSIILEGFCKTHRPKVLTGSVIELPHHLAKQINGRGAKGKMKRLERALYVDVVPSGGVRRHAILRNNRREEQGWLSEPVVTLCEKTLRRAYVPTIKEAREDYPDTCPKCDKAKTVVQEDTV